MSEADIKARASHARSFLAAMVLIRDLGEEADVVDVRNVLASLAVLAGVAAADAICGSAFGHRSQGESHIDATVLLQKTANGKKPSMDLRRLLGEKTNSQYGSGQVSASTATSMFKQAERLVATMESQLQR